MMRIGPSQLLLIIGVTFFLMYVVGPKNLPKMGRMFGETMREVRKGMAEFSEEIHAASVEIQAQQNSGPQTERITVDPNRKVAQIIYEDEIDTGEM